jgi:hypothetical protein
MKAIPVIMVMLLIAPISSSFALSSVPSHSGASAMERTDWTGGNDLPFIARPVTIDDIPAMMARWGVSQPGSNYNVLIGGHGTGDVPPSREGYLAMVGKTMLYEPASRGPLTSLPPSVDWSPSPYFPPIGNQGSQGSCAAWNIGYYVNGYLQRKDNNWTDSSNTSQLTSPSWVYNKNNYGVDGGTNRENNVALIASIGDAILATMPYNQADFRSWGGEAAWRTAPANRLESEFDITDPWNTNLIKYWLAQGDVLSISFDADILNSGIGSDMVVSSKEYVHGASNHAVTIVGYDDMKTADNDSGAFKIANSWGKGWGSLGGYFWMTYDALAEIPDRDILRLHDRTDYEPSILAAVNQSVPGSIDSSISLGSGSGKYPDFKPFWRGHQSISGALPAFPQFLAFDLTDFSEDLGLSGFWLRVGAGRNANANISVFGIEWYPDGYGPGHSFLSLNSSQTPAVAPTNISIDALEDIFTAISSPSNGSWQRGTVTINGTAAGAINRTVFSEDFESWSPSDNWNVKDVYKTGRDYNGWAVSRNRAIDGERSLWSAGSDDMRIFLEDFEQAWPPSGWAVSSAGPDSYPFARSKGAYRGSGTYDYLSVANSSRGAGTNMTERLYMTTPVNVSCHQNLSLEFYLDYDYNSTDEYAEVQYSTQNIYPAFTQLKSYSGDTWGYQRIDLSFLDGNDSVYISFVYHGTDDHYMAVDDVVIAGNKTRYDPDMNAYVEKAFGNISSLDGAKLEYSSWMDTETDTDILQTYYRTSPAGSMQFLENLTGRGQKWNLSSLDIPSNATVVGLLFKSNSSISYEGAYLDGMCLTGYTQLDEVMVRVDNGSWAPAGSSPDWSYDWDSTLVAEGEHYITVRANYSDAYAYSHSLINIDNTPPAVMDCGNGPLTTGDIGRFYINSSDPRGIGKVELLYSINAGPQNALDLPQTGNDSWLLDLNVPSNATTLSYKFRVQDGIGNVVETANRDVDVIDDDPPLLGNDTTPDSATTGDPVTFCLSPSDNIAVLGTTLEYWYGDGDHLNITAPGTPFVRNVTVLDTLEKLHYSFSVVDTSGNRASGPNRSISVSDNDLPSILDLSPEDATTGEEFVLQCDATDNLNVSSVSVQFRFGNGTPEELEMTYNASYRLTITVPDTLEPLNYTITAVDSSGNSLSTSPKNVAIRDNDAPVLQEDSSPATAFTGEDFVFNITSSDNIGVSSVEIIYRFGANQSRAILPDLRTITISVPVNSLDELVYIARITDTSGNTFTSDERTVPVLDSILPVFVRDGSQTLPTTGETFNFSVDAHDNIGIVKMSVEYRFGSKASSVIQMGGNGPYTCTITIPPNAAGTMQYAFIAVDAAGNENRTLGIILEVRDNDSPVISGVDTPRQANFGPVRFSINVTDNMAVQSVTAFLWSEAGHEFSFSLSGQTIQWTGTYVFLADGIYYYRFIVQDPSGNLAETSASPIHIGANTPETPDITPPSVVITYPAMRAELPAGTNELTVRWSASDNGSGLAGCELAVDSGPGIDAGMDMHYLISGLQNGTHILKVHARDKAGNTGTATSIFTISDSFVDSTPPQIKITRPKNNQVRNDKKLTAAWTGSDAGSKILGYFVKLDDSPWIFVGPATSQILNLTANGRHSLTVRALDQQGNIAEDTVSFKLEPKPAQGSNMLMMGSILVAIIVVLAIGAALYLRRKKSNSHQ